MKIFCKFPNPTINISTLNFWLVSIAKNFIWSTLKAIFSIFRFFFALSNSRFSNSCISANYSLLSYNNRITSMESLFIDGFLVQGHKWHSLPRSPLLYCTTTVDVTVYLSVRARLSHSTHMKHKSQTRGIRAHLIRIFDKMSSMCNVKPPKSLRVKMIQRLLVSTKFSVRETLNGQLRFISCVSIIPKSN